jgi:predicted transcriptional regulator with HTH domain
MPTISKVKKDRISEQILHFLFEVSPESKFTSDISREIARDEEFIKSLLLDLEKKGLVNIINKNKSGKEYTKRQRWRLSNQAFEAYSKAQNNKNTNNTLQNNNIYNNEDEF